MSKLMTLKEATTAAKKAHCLSPDGRHYAVRQSKELYGKYYICPVEQVDALEKNTAEVFYRTDKP